MLASLPTLGLSFLAGGLSILSPCVLPLLPIVLGSAASAHRHGPLALALGLGFSFTLAGTVLAAVGLNLGFDQGWLRDIAAVLLLFFGVAMVSDGLHARIAGASSGLSRIGDALSRRLALDGLPGQFALGAVLGLVWSPCVGPTLGAAVTLASQRSSLDQVVLVMLLFGIGAALPLAVLGQLSREFMLRLRARLMRIGSIGTHFFGALMILVGISILTGLDKKAETQLVQWSPDWLTDLTTRF